jgi:hypothetical protein
MFLGNAEYVAYERQKDALRQAEQMRLVKSLPVQSTEYTLHKLRLSAARGLGGQLVKWGLRLQGDKSSWPPPAIVSGTSKNR